MGSTGTLISRQYSISPVSRSVKSWAPFPCTPSISPIFNVATKKVDMKILQRDSFPGQPLGAPIFFPLFSALDLKIYTLFKKCFGRTTPFNFALPTLWFNIVSIMFLNCKISHCFFILNVFLSFIFRSFKLSTLYSFWSFYFSALWIFCYLNSALYFLSFF